MGWASPHIEKLKAGNTVQFRPHGNSMRPRIASGQLVTVEPVKGPLTVGDIVLCKVHGKEYLHLITAIRGDCDYYQISNNRGHINGWAPARSIFGVCTRIEP